MSIRTALSAFFHRAVPRRHALELLGYSGGLVVGLLLLSAWICAQQRAAPNHFYEPIPWDVLALADLFALLLLALGLFVLVPATIAAQVAAERRSGTLDQLRTTPLDPLALVAGFVFAAPARLYLLAVGPLALHVFAGLSGRMPLDTLVATLVTLAVGTVVSALLGLLVALAPRQDSGGALVALGVAGLLGGAGLIAALFVTERILMRWAFLHPAGALHASMLAHDGLWRHLAVSPWRLGRFAEPAFVSTLGLQALLSASVCLPAAILLARAACRRLQAPERPLLGKGVAVALFTLAAASAILPVERAHHGASLAFAALVLGLLLLPVQAVLGFGAAPSFEGWALALRQKRQVGPFDDAAPPHGAMWAMLLVWLALVALRLGPPRLPESRQWAFVWGVWLALTSPVLVHFGATRWLSAGARWAFGVAAAAYLLVEVVGIGITSFGHVSGSDATFVELAGLLAVVVPGWVALRQHALKRRTLARI